MWTTLHRRLVSSTTWLLPVPPTTTQHGNCSVCVNSELLWDVTTRAEHDHIVRFIKHEIWYSRTCTSSACMRGSGYGRGEMFSLRVMFWLVLFLLFYLQLCLPWYDSAHRLAHDKKHQLFFICQYPLSWSEAGGKWCGRYSSCSRVVAAPHHTCFSNHFFLVGIIWPEICLQKSSWSTSNGKISNETHQNYTHHLSVVLRCLITSVTMSMIFRVHCILHMVLATAFLPADCCPTD